MKIDKVTGQYNTYKVELSYAQLLAVRNALRDSHTTPESDEMLEELDWYLDNVPRPGEDKDGQDTSSNTASNADNDFDLDSELPDPDLDTENDDLEAKDDLEAEDELDEPEPELDTEPAR